MKSQNKFEKEITNKFEKEIAICCIRLMEINFGRN